MDEFGQLFGSLPSGDWYHDTINQWAQNQWSMDYLLGNTPAHQMLRLAEQNQRQAIAKDNIEKTDIFFQSIRNQNSNLVELANSHSEFNYQAFELGFLHQEIIQFDTAVHSRYEEVVKWAKKGNDRKAQPWFQEVIRAAKELYDRVVFLQGFAFNFDKYWHEMSENCSDEGLPWKVLTSVRTTMEEPGNFGDRFTEVVELESKLSQAFDELFAAHNQAGKVILEEFEKLKLKVNAELVERAVKVAGDSVTTYLIKMKEMEKFASQFGVIAEELIKEEERSSLAKEIAKEMGGKENSLEEKLKENSSLLAKGVITEEEYAARRAKLIEMY
jgi:hypothetical protein